MKLWPLFRRWLYRRFGRHSFHNYQEWYTSVLAGTWKYQFGRHCRYCGKWEIWYE